MTDSVAIVPVKNVKKEAVKDAKEVKPKICIYCKGVPCVWSEFQVDNKSMLLSLRRAVESGGRPGKARKTVFQSMSRKINGMMGVGNRRRLPQCVEDNVRKMFPSEDGRYMGYKDK